MTLNLRTKEAIKTALAMTIAYGIALSMDWDKPYWAGFAVAFISLSTVGQSLNKGAMRMLGTLVAFVVSLTLIALFAQERWWFMVALSTYFGFCTYMNGGTKRQYFWFVAGFATVIIAFDGGTNAENAFDTAVLRAQETGLGILVYTLVTILLWPTSSRDELDAAVRQLATTQHELYRRYRGLPDGREKEEDTHALRMQEVQHFNRFSQALAAARTDSYEVWEVRGQWVRIEAQAEELMVTLERWRESLKEVRELDLKGLLPNLEALGEEVEGRFEQTVRMLEGKPPERTPRVVELPLNKGAAQALSHFQKAALTVTRTRLQHLEGLTRSLFEALADIKGFAAASPQSTEAIRPRSGFLPDPDRIAASIRAMAGLWLAYLLWVYLEALPGGAGIMMSAAPIGMSLANMPQAPVSMLFKPAAASIAFAGFLYIFVMPQLSSFAGLGPMIFLATFVICYLFASPKQGLGRAFGLAMFVTIAGISNQQSYNFLSVADTAAMFVLLFAILAITANIPHLARPEKAFQRLLGRFFRSCEYLMTTMRWNIDMTPTRLDLWRKAFHEREVETLPQKLVAWGKAVDTKVLPGTTPEQVQALTTNIQALAYRMQEQLEARESTQAAFLVRELLEDVRGWRLKVQEVFQGWSRDPATPPVDVLRERLAARLEQLEGRIEETLDKAAEGELTDQDSERLYRLLGAYRGLAEAGLEYARTARGIEWSRWRESRF
jgi:uncharacterized membrane protein YccC